LLESNARYLSLPERPIAFGQRAFEAHLASSPVTERLVAALCIRIPGFNVRPFGHPGYLTAVSILLAFANFPREREAVFDGHFDVRDKRVGAGFPFE